MAHLPRGPQQPGRAHTAYPHIDDRRRRFPDARWVGLGRVWNPAGEDMWLHFQTGQPSACIVMHYRCVGEASKSGGRMDEVSWHCIADVRASRCWRWDSKWMAGRDPPTGTRRVRRASMTRIWLILSFPRVGRRPECRQGGSIGCCAVRRGTVGVDPAGAGGLLVGVCLGAVWRLLRAPKEKRIRSKAFPSLAGYRIWPHEETLTLPLISGPGCCPRRRLICDLTSELSRRSRGSVRQI